MRKILEWIHKMLIGLTQQTDKLVFVRSLLSLRDQSA